MMELVAEKKIEIRFSEVDVMNVVWHGSYPLYFEDAREAFGAKYGLSYKRYMDEKVFAPIVELDIKYKRPILYGMTPVVRIVYRPTEAAKISGRIFARPPRRRAMGVRRAVMRKVRLVSADIFVHLIVTYLRHSPCHFVALPPQ